jgi:hypothetical protein
MAQFVNEFMNEILAAIVLVPPVAAVVFIVAIGRLFR